MVETSKSSEEIAVEQEIQAEKLTGAKGPHDRWARLRATAREVIDLDVKHIGKDAIGWVGRVRRASQGKGRGKA